MENPEPSIELNQGKEENKESVSPARVIVNQYEYKELIESCKDTIEIHDDDIQARQK